MPDYEIIFKTKAELAGARALQESLERQIGAAKAAGKDFSELQKQVDKVNASLAGAGKEGAFEKLREGLGEIIPGFSQLDGILSKLGKGGVAAVAGGFAALAGGLEAAKHSLEEFANQEQRVARLDAALAQTGNLTNEYRERLQELAHELQHTSGVAEEEWLAVLTKLTQFGAEPSNIDAYADAVKNLAGILGGDLQTAATLISRALQGNFLMFARYGIQVGEAGTQTEKLEGLMRQLAQRGGGQLEAVTKTLGGHFTELKHSTADLFKAFGRGIAETGVLQGALTVLSDGVSYWAEKLGGPIEKVEGLGNAAVATTQKIDGATPSASYATSLDRIKVAAELATLRLEGLKAAALAFNQAEEEIAAAKKEHEIADVEAKVQSGAMTKPEGERQKGLIETRGITDAAARKRGQLEVENRYAAADMQMKDYAAFIAQEQLQNFKTQQKRMKAVEPARALAKTDAENLRAAEEHKEELEGQNKRGPNAYQAAGFMAFPPAMIIAKKAEDKKRAEELQQLNKEIERLRTIAEQSKANADELESNHAPQGDINDLKKRAQETKDAAAAARQTYENSRRVIDIQRGAVDVLESEKGKTQETKASTAAAKAEEEEQKKKDAELKRRLQEHYQHGLPMRPVYSSDFHELNTSLTPAEEALFQLWKKKHAPDDSGADYDLRGAYKAGVRPDGDNGHWPDTFKKPNHPTFSVESKFAKDFPDRAGRWEGETFVPPPNKRRVSHERELDDAGVDISEGTKDISKGLSAIKDKISDAFAQISDTVEGVSDTLDGVNQRLAALESRTGNRA